MKTLKFFEVGIHGEQDLVTYSGHLHLGQIQAQLLDHARSTGAAVANESSRFVVPLSKQKIDCVLERAGGSMVVLGRDENVGIENGDLSRPPFGVRLTVLPHYCWRRLVEQRQVEIFDVYEFEFGVAALFRDFIDPLRYRLAISTRARASISVAVDRLVKKGLVSRKDHPDDRRVRRVELTPKGRALISRGFGEHAAAMENVAGILSKTNG